MNSFAILLDNIMDNLQMKYGFNIEATEFTPDIVLEYTSDQTVEIDDSYVEVGKGEAPSKVREKKEVKKVKGLVPTEPSTRSGDSRGTGHNKLFWDEKNKSWLPKDIYNATLALKNDDSFKLESQNDKNILIKKLDTITGTLDFSPFVNEVSGLFENIFSISSSTKSDTESLDKKMDKLYDQIKKLEKDEKKDEIKPIRHEIDKIRSEKSLIYNEATHQYETLSLEIKNSLENFKSKHNSQISSREEFLKDVKAAYGEKVAIVIKRIVLRSKSPSKIKETVEKIIGYKPDTYIPEFDATKKRFEEEDRKYILGVIQQHHKSGFKPILKELASYFRKGLLEELNVASRIYGTKGYDKDKDKGKDVEIDGVVNYLMDYDNLRGEVLEKMTRGEPESESPMPEISALVKPPLAWIETAKKSVEKGYKGSFVEFTEDFLKAVLAYSRSSKKIPEFEYAIADILGGSNPEKRGSLSSAWADANMGEMSKTMGSLAVKLADEFNFTLYEIKEKKFKNNPNLIYENLEKDYSNLPYVKTIFELKNKQLVFERRKKDEDKSDKEQDAMARLNEKDLDFAKELSKNMAEKDKKEKQEIAERGLTKDEKKQIDEIYNAETKLLEDEEIIRKLDIREPDEDWYRDHLNKRSPEEKKKDPTEKIMEERRKNFLLKLRESNRSDVVRGVAELKNFKTKEWNGKNKDILNAINKLKGVEILYPDDKAKSLLDNLAKEVAPLTSYTEKQTVEFEKKVRVIISRLEEQMKAHSKKYESFENFMKENREKEKEKKEEEYAKNNRYVEPEELTPAEIKEYGDAYQNALVIHFMAHNPDILYRREPSKEALKQIKSLENEKTELDKKDSLTAKEEKRLDEIEELISKLEGAGAVKVPLSEEESVKRVLELKQRAVDLQKQRGNDDERFKDLQFLYISENDFKKWKSEKDKMDDKQKKILEKAGIIIDALFKHNRDTAQDESSNSDEKDPLSKEKRNLILQKKDLKKGDPRIKKIDSDISDIDKKIEAIQNRNTRKSFVTETLTKLASLTNHRFVKAELESISEHLNDL